MRLLSFLAVLTVILSLKGFSIELKLLKTFPEAEAPKSVVVSPDGKYAAVMNLEGLNFWLIDTQTLKIKEKVQFTRTPAKGWDYQNKKPINSFAEKPVECDFSDGGRYLWVSFHNGADVVRYDITHAEYTNGGDLQKAKVFDYEGKTNYITFMPKIKVGKTPKVIKVTPDGKYILVANWHSSSVSVIDPALMKNIIDIKLGGKNTYIPRGIAVAPDSKTAYIANMGGGTISYLDLAGLQVIKDIPVSPNPRHIVLSKDGKYLYVSENANGMVLKFNLETGKVEKRVEVGSQARTIEVTPDEKYLFAAAHYSGKVVVVDLGTFKIVKSVEMERPMGISVSPDGKQLWVTSYQGGFVRAYEITE